MRIGDVGMYCDCRVGDKVGECTLAGTGEPKRGRVLLHLTTQVLNIHDMLRVYGIGSFESLYEEDCEVSQWDIFGPEVVQRATKNSNLCMPDVVEEVEGL